MRKINGKLFLGLLVGLLFCGGAVFGVHHLQYGRIADSLMWQARRAEELGEVRRQAKYLQRYLEFNPKDAAAKARLAELWTSEAFAESSKERLKAVRLLDEVLTRGMDQPDLRRLLVKTALEVRNLKMARNHLEILLPFKQVRQTMVEAPVGESRPDAQRGEVEGYWAQLLEAENKPGEAMSCCRLAMRHAPAIQSNYVRLASLLRGQKELSPAQARKSQREADQVIDGLVDKNPQSHEAYLARWRYRRDFGLVNTLKDQPGDRQVALKDAAEDVAQALKRAPEVVDVLLAAADLERLLGQAVAQEDDKSDQKEKRLREHRDKAYEFLQRGLKLHARKGAPAASDMTQFRLLWHKSNLLLDDLKRLDESHSAAQAADLAEQRQQWTAEAAQTIEQVRKTRGSPAAADYLKARLLLHERRWAEAVALFEQVRPVLAGQVDLAGQINLYLGQCYEQLEEPRQMFNAYQRLLESDPASVIAVLGMAQAEWSIGRLDNAAEKFKQLSIRGQLPDKVWLDYARLEIQRQPQQSKPNWEWVENLLELARKANPNSVDVPLAAAQMWVVRQDMAKARQVLEKAQAARAKEIDLWTARVHLELRDKKLDAAKKVLDAAKRELKDHVLLRLAEARCLAETKQKGVEEAINRLASNSGGFTEEDQARLLNGLADTQLNLENVQSARALWQRVAKLPSHRTDLRLRLLLFDLAVKAEDEDGMKSTLEDIRGVEGSQGAFHRYGEALRLIWQARKTKAEERQKKLDEARVHLDRVQSLRAAWPPLFLARAQIDSLSNRPDRAISNLQEAVRNGETSPAVIRDLVELLAGAERYGEADEALRHLRDPLLVNSELGRLATTVAVGMKNNRRALDLLNKNRAPKDAKNYRELLWEGRMSAELNKLEEAEEKLREAVRLADKEPEPYVALVQFLARQKRDKEAEAVLDRAKARLPRERAELALAQCEVALGRIQSAQARYEEALNGHRQDATIVRRVAGFYWNAGELAKAEPLLRDIVERRVKDPSAEDVNWARWHLALVLASGTDYGRFREALSLVGLQLDGNGQLVRDRARGREDSSDGRRFQARVLAAQAGHRQFRQRAIELLAGLEHDKALRPDDRFILALLYEAERAWVKAKPILIDLVDRRDPAPRHLAHFVQTLIESNELDEAAKWADKLEKLEEERGSEPNAFAAVELRARLLEARDPAKGGEKALKLLENHIKRPKANADEVVLLLNSMRRQKKLAEAFELCKRKWEEKKCSAEVIGGASVALLRDMQISGAPATDAQVQFIETRLQAAIAQHPKSVVLMLHLADLYDKRGRYAEAVARYRQVLRPENEPKNIVALNNLAWLLAQGDNDLADALEQIEKAVNGIGHRADLIDTRGMVHLKMGQGAKALADFKEATADLPTPTHLFHLALAHHKARDKTSAYKVLKEAKEHGLQASNLHPVERKECQRLLEELKVR